MTVIELNAQLLRELSYIYDNEGYLRKTLDFIKKLTKSNVASNVRGQIYTEMLERLSDFQEYEKGWDGDDAQPLSRQVVKNFKAVLQKSRDSELEGWTFFHYSYYEIVDGEVKGENNLRFSPKSVIETMKRI